MYLKSIGVDPKVAKAVVYPGGGPAQTAMLGGHIDVYVASPRSMVPLQKEGTRDASSRSRPPQRQPGANAELPDLPGAGPRRRVLHVARLHGTERTEAARDRVLGPGLRSKLAQSEEWRKDTEQQLWNADYLLSAETRKHLDRENEQLKVILTDLGLAKQ